MDGGIDGFYALISDEPLNDSHIASPPRRPTLDILLFQSKLTPSFSGLALDKIISTMSTLFDLGRDLDELTALYDEVLLERVRTFRSFYETNFAALAHTTIRIVYATRGESPHVAFGAQVATIEELGSRLFPEAEVTFSFVGAAELLEMLRTPRPDWLELSLADNAISVGDGGYVALVRLADFADFLTDEEGRRRQRLFLSNVRDYEGDNRVNAAIASTLRDPTSVDFWMLNNGITIVADEVKQSYRTLALREPKIVNGLQTSTVVYRHFSERRSAAAVEDASPRPIDSADDERSVLVRIAVPVNAAARDRIIVATNSQTNISPAVLRATDSIHSDLEDYFRSTGLFYERRRNSHRSEGVRIDRVVTIPHLARAVTAVVLQQPYLAVKLNSQTRLVAKDENYQRIFDGGYPLPMFGACIAVTKRIEQFLDRQPNDEAEFDTYYGQSRRPTLWYTQWHVATILAAKWVPHHRVTPQSIGALQVDEISDDDIDRTIRRVNGYFAKARSDNKRTVYRLAVSQANSAGLIRKAQTDWTKW